MIPVERLKTIPLFARLDDEVLAHLAPLFHRVHFKRGDLVCEQGNEGDAFYVLEAGSLQVRHVDGQEQDSVLGYLSAPAYFGETSLLTGLERDVTMQVFTPSADLAVLQKFEFDALLNRHPQAKPMLAIRDEVRGKLAQRGHAWLTEGEVVLVQARRHVYALVVRLIGPAIVVAVLLALAALARALDPATLRLPIPVSVWSSAGPLLTALAAVTAVAATVWHGVDWHNDSFIVTNKRVIHIEKMIWFFEDRVEAPIEQVTNVLEMASGWQARLLGFSDLYIETAGRRVDMHFSHARRSLQLRQKVLEQVERVRDRAAFERRERVRSGIREELWQRLAPTLASQSGDPAAAVDMGEPVGSQGATFTGIEAEGDVPQVATAPEPARSGQVPVPLEPVRRRQITSLGRWINEWVGLRIEEPGRVTWRKHWFNLIRRIDEPAAMLVILLVIGGLHFSGVVPLRVFGDGESLTRRVALVGLWGLALALVLFWLWYQYEDWGNDIYRVTDEHVIDIERSPFGLRERSVETTLDRVQDISVERRGILPNLLNYGTLIIETAGSGRILFFDVIEPGEAAKEIFRRREVYRDHFQREEAKQARRGFIDWFMEYHRFLQDQRDQPAPDPALALPPDAEPPEIADS